MERKVLIIIAAAAVAIVIIFPTLSMMYPTDTQVIHKHVVHNHVNTNKSIYLNGTLINKNNGKYLNGTVCIENTTSGKTYQYTVNGNYSIKLPHGDYSVKFSSTGFKNNYISLNSSTRYTAHMSGVSSLGSQIGIYTGSNVTKTVPYLNNSFLKSYLGNDTSLKLQNNKILMKFFNGTTNTTIQDKTFVLFLKVNGNIYKFTNKTNSKGESYVPLGYSGSYIMSAYFLNYRANEKTYNINKNQTINMSLNYIPSYKHTLTLKTYKYNGNSSVNSTGLSINGGIFSINTSSYKDNNGTYYNFSVPEGVYTFTYNHKYYVKKNFMENITAHASTFNKNISAYLLNITDHNSSYNYTVNNGMMYNSSHIFKETPGSYLIGIYYHGTFIKYDYVSLTNATPAYNINITLKDGNASLNLVSSSYTKSNNTTVNTFKFSNSNGSIYIYRIDLYSSVYANRYIMVVNVNGQTIFTGYNVTGQNQTPGSLYVTGSGITLKTSQSGIYTTNKGGAVYFISVNTQYTQMEEF